MDIQGLDKIAQYYHELPLMAKMDDTYMRKTYGDDYKRKSEQWTTQYKKGLKNNATSAAQGVADAGVRFLAGTAYPLTSLLMRGGNIIGSLPAFVSSDPGKTRVQSFVDRAREGNRIIDRYMNRNAYKPLSKTQRAVNKLNPKSNGFRTFTDIYVSSLPYLLAGGLGSKTVTTAAAATKPAVKRGLNAIGSAMGYRAIERMPEVADALTSSDQY